MGFVLPVPGFISEIHRFLLGVSKFGTIENELCMIGLVQGEHQLFTIPKEGCMETMIAQSLDSQENTSMRLQNLDQAASP